MGAKRVKDVPPRLVSVATAARMMSIGYGRLYEKIRSGEFPYVRNGTRGKLVDLADIDRWIEKNKVGAIE